jgi:hypothetical protein
MTTRKRTVYGKDKRRTHHHWQVTLFYEDGDRFTRTYTDHDKAKDFAARQKKSPLVMRTRVSRLS